MASNPLYVFFLSVLLVVGGGVFLAIVKPTDPATLAAVLAAFSAVVFYWFGRKPPI